MDDLAKDVAALLREAASTFILPRFGRLTDGDIETKSSPTDLVTVADREAETWLTPRLAGIVDAVVIGEEACAATPSLRGRTAESQAWTVDPVDGTSNFVKGNERFCSMVSLLESGVPVRSWIWLPLADELYYAQTGKGAFRSDLAFTAPHRLTLDGCDLALDDMKGGASIRDVAEPARTQMRDKLRALPGRWFPGSGGVLGTAIASGAQNFLFHATCTPWDHAPVDLLCREAGAHSAMMTSGAPYNATMAGGLLVASCRDSWQRFSDYLSLSQG